MAAILSSHTPWREALEAMHAPGLDESAWLRGVVDALRPAFPRAGALLANVVEFSESGQLRRARSAEPSSTLRDVEAMIASGAPCCPAGVDPLPLSPDVRARLGIVDDVALVVHPLPGLVTGIDVVFNERTPISPADRRLLFQFSAHLDSAHRLRERAESVVAVLDEQGRLVHREDTAPPELDAHAKRVMQARATRELSGMALWPALLEGRLSIVPRRTGTRTELYVLENPQDTHHFRALSDREAAVLRLACQGMTNVSIAYWEGISEPTVSRALASAAWKAGAASRVELVRIAAVLLRDERSEMNDVVLTAAERDILELLQRGLSNPEIAAARSRSVRTIANQVAAILHKTSSDSRRSLVTRADPNERAHRTNS